MKIEEAESLIPWSEEGGGGWGEEEENKKPCSFQCYDNFLQSLVTTEELHTGKIDSLTVYLEIWC